MSGQAGAGDAEQSAHAVVFRIVVGVRHVVLRRLLIRAEEEARVAALGRAGGLILPRDRLAVEAAARLVDLLLVQVEGGIIHELAGANRVRDRLPAPEPVVRKFDVQLLIVSVVDPRHLAGVGVVQVFRLNAPRPGADIELAVGGVFILDVRALRVELERQEARRVVVYPCRRVGVAGGGRPRRTGPTGAAAVCLHHPFAPEDVVDVLDGVRRVAPRPRVAAAGRDLLGGGDVSLLEVLHLALATRVGPHRDGLDPAGARRVRVAREVARGVGDGRDLPAGVVFRRRRVPPGVCHRGLPADGVVVVGRRQARLRDLLRGQAVDDRRDLRRGRVGVRHRPRDGLAGADDRDDRFRLYRVTRCAVRVHGDGSLRLAAREAGELAHLLAREHGRRAAIHVDRVRGDLPPGIGRVHDVGRIRFRDAVGAVAVKGIAGVHVEPGRDHIAQQVVLMERRRPAGRGDLPEMPLAVRRGVRAWLVSAAAVAVVVGRRERGAVVAGLLLLDRTAEGVDERIHVHGRLVAARVDASQEGVGVVAIDVVALDHVLAARDPVDLLRPAVAVVLGDFRILAGAGDGDLAAVAVGEAVVVGVGRGEVAGVGRGQDPPGPVVRRAGGQCPLGGAGAALDCLGDVPAHRVVCVRGRDRRLCAVARLGLRVDTLLLRVEAAGVAGYGARLVGRGVQAAGAPVEVSLCAVAVVGVRATALLVVGVDRPRHIRGRPVACRVEVAIGRLLQQDPAGHVADGPFLRALSRHERWRRRRADRVRDGRYDGIHGLPETRELTRYRAAGQVIVSDVSVRVDTPVGVLDAPDLAGLGARDARTVAIVSRGRDEVLGGAELVRRRGQVPVTDLDLDAVAVAVVVVRVVRPSDDLALDRLGDGSWLVQVCGEWVRFRRIGHPIIAIRDDTGTGGVALAFGERLVLPGVDLGGFLIARPDVAVDDPRAVGVGNGPDPVVRVVLVGGGQRRRGGGVDGLRLHNGSAGGELNLLLGDDGVGGILDLVGLQAARAAGLPGPGPAADERFGRVSILELPARIDIGVVVERGGVAAVVHPQRDVARWIRKRPDAGGGRSTSAIESHFKRALAGVHIVVVDLDPSPGGRDLAQPVVVAALVFDAGVPDGHFRGLGDAEALGRDQRPVRRRRIGFVVPEEPGGLPLRVLAEV